MTITRFNVATPELSVPVPVPASLGLPQAEFCHFIEGESSFTPDGQNPIEIRPGIALFFRANTQGVWDVRKTTRKVFIVFDEGTPN